ncbi:hypothetical protein [Virgibacillus halodenitrificans]|uniref:hypothetical protein n=1 Tax=Virgibacillus halodenitrificans TaxID=1482 RepID=UPI0002EB13ED|nr:hypothetical protein [Virgibacillus halodenitrificans]
MKKGILVILMILFLTGCQSSDDESSKKDTILNEKPEITITQGNKIINTKVVVDCWVDNCTEETGSLDEINIEHLTEDLEANKVTSKESLTINVDGTNATQWGYFVAEDWNTSRKIKEGVLKNNKIEINGDGEKRYLITGSWYDDDEFIGTVSKTFILKVK